MSLHSYHPDVHERGLADDCPRCEEHSWEPWKTMDPDMLAILRDRIRTGANPRSINEALAMKHLEQYDKLRGEVQ